MPRSAALLATAAALLLAGCGDDAPSPEAQVRDTLTTFSTAVEGKDYAKLCDEVFAPELLEGLQGIGLPCEVAMRTSLEGLEAPKLTVGDVKVDGERATAEVRTSAQGQPPSTDTLELQRVSEEWRVSALSGGEEEAEPSETPSVSATPKSTAKPTRTPKPKPKPKKTAKPKATPEKG